MAAGRKIARYKEIAAYLVQRITDGTFPAGQPLPSEEQLGKEFGVSRQTVRDGIAELRAMGLVEVHMGRGSFVRSPDSRPNITRPRGVRRDKTGHYSEADGIRWTTTDTPQATRTDAPVALADLLRIPPGEPMFTYDQHETADHGRLRQLHRTYIPFSVLAGTRHEDTTPPPAPALFEMLRDLGHELHFTEYIRTRMPLPDEATALRLSEGVPLLNIHRLTLNQHDRPLCLEDMRIPGDDLEVSFTYPTTS